MFDRITIEVDRYGRGEVTIWKGSYPTILDVVDVQAVVSQGSIPVRTSPGGLVAYAPSTTQYEFQIKALPNRPRSFSTLDPPEEDYY